ncbi:MAG: copper resistance protein NlpE [Bacteroides sp.]
MKKVILLAAVVAALASCQSKTQKAEVAAEDSLAVEMTPVIETTQVYEGTIPASKGAPAMNYLLTLDELADSNDTLYTLDMTSLDANQQPTTKKVTLKGTPKMIQKVVKNAKKQPVTKKALQLNPSDGSAPLYFLVTNDTTLTLTDGNLQESVSDVGCDLVKVK